MDGQTDDMQLQYRTKRYSASRGKNLKVLLVALVVLIILVTYLMVIFYYCEYMYS